MWSARYWHELNLESDFCPIFAWLLEKVNDTAVRYQYWADSKQTGLAVWKSNFRTPIDLTIASSAPIHSDGSSINPIEVSEITVLTPNSETERLPGLELIEVGVSVLAGYEVWLVVCSVSVTFFLNPLSVNLMRVTNTTIEWFKNDSVS